MKYLVLLLALVMFSCENCADDEIKLIKLTKERDEYRELELIYVNELAKYDPFTTTDFAKYMELHTELEYWSFKRALTEWEITQLKQESKCL